MTNSITIQIDGVTYRKSLSSKSGGGYCVGVGLKNGKISVINTKSDGPVVKFSPQEWAAFLEGVKAGEFDLHRLVNS